MKSSISMMLLSSSFGMMFVGANALVTTPNNNDHRRKQQQQQERIGVNGFLMNNSEENDMSSKENNAYEDNIFDFNNNNESPSVGEVRAFDNKDDNRVEEFTLDEEDDDDRIATKIGSFYAEMERSIVSYWIVVFIQLFLSYLLLIFYPILRHCCCFRYAMIPPQQEKQEIDHSNTSNYFSIYSMASAMNDEERDSDNNNMKNHANASPVMKTKRSQTNFNKTNDNLTIDYPSDYSSEYVTLEQNNDIDVLSYSKVLHSILSKRETADMLRTAFGFAFLSSGLSSMLSIFVSYTFYMQQICNMDDYSDTNTMILYFMTEWKVNGTPFCVSFQEAEITHSFWAGNLPHFASFEKWYGGVSGSLLSAIKLFNFLPITLMLAALAFLVARWRRFMVTCHIIQGRIHDIALLCGTLANWEQQQNNNNCHSSNHDITTIDNNIMDTTTKQGQKKEQNSHDCHSKNNNGQSTTTVMERQMKEQVQQKLYTIYRRLNAVHILCLKSFSPHLCILDSDPLLFHHTMNLLTLEEVTRITLAERKGRDAMVGLLKVAIEALLEDPLVQRRGVPHVLSNATVLNSKICDLRGECWTLHDLFIQDNPNEYTLSILGFLWIYKLLIVIMSPMQWMALDSIAFFCIQPGVFLGVLFTFLSLSFPFVLYKILQNPFDEKGGINVDNLISSTELMIFHLLRTQWHLNDDDEDNVNENDDDVSFYSSKSNDDDNNDPPPVRRLERKGSIVDPRMTYACLRKRSCRFEGSVLRGGFGDL